MKMMIASKDIDQMDDQIGMYPGCSSLRYLRRLLPDGAYADWSIRVDII